MQNVLRLTLNPACMWTAQKERRCAVAKELLTKITLGSMEKNKLQYNRFLYISHFRLLTILYWCCSALPALSAHCQCSFLTVWHYGLKIWKRHEGERVWKVSTVPVSRLICESLQLWEMLAIFIVMQMYFALPLCKLYLYI